MNKKVTIVAVLLLILLPLSLVTYNLFRAQDIMPSGSGKQTITNDNFTLEYEYKGNNRWAYTVSGVLPNPCYEVSVDETVMESSPEQVQIGININPPQEDEMCAQVLYEFEHTGKFSASEKAEVELKYFLNI
jgi:hypothetical protein